MNLQIKLAENEEELDAVFRGRYRVFVETDAYMAPNDENRLYDRFDSYPTSANFVALHEREVIGGLRFTERSAVGSSSEEAFDFGFHAPAPSEVYGTGSWLFLDQPFRKATGVTFCLWTLAYAWARQRHWSRLFCVANPSILPRLLDHGFRQLGEVRFDRRKNLPFVPIMRDLRELDARMHTLVAALQRRGRLTYKGIDLYMPSLSKTRRQPILRKLGNVEGARD